jgi:hypothetical protein
LEGNLETKIFTDPVTGLVRRVREVAIRRNGIYITFSTLLTQDTWQMFLLHIYEIICSF